MAMTLKDFLVEPPSTESVSMRTKSASDRFRRSSTATSTARRSARSVATSKLSVVSSPSSA